MERVDLLVVGGGPSGAVAARAAAEAGARVRIVERRRPGDPPPACTGLVSPRTLGALGAADASIVREIRAARLHAPGGRSAELRGSTVKAVVLDRARLEEDLLDRARSAGVEIETETDAIGFDGRTVTVRGPRGARAIAPAVLIGADGPASAVAAWCGLEPPPVAIGAQAVVEAPVGASDRVDVYAGESVAPGFFAWAVPAEEGRVRVGLLCDPGDDPAGRLDRLLRERFPDEDEQRVLYREVLERFAPRPVVMRTLDVGGDKALPYFPVVEDNPFLGWRGIRITLDHPEIFLVQVRAMLRASSGLGNLQILLPMISGVDEVDESLQLIHRAYAEVVEEEGPSIAMPRVGVMVEVPSAVYQIRALARRVDFLSVGSNDLTQYLLAVDRNNARVAGLFNTLHPGVLHALKQVVDGAHLEGRPVSICGEMAGDPVAAVILMGLGFDTLSMGVPSVPLVKWAIRNITLDRARELALEVLEFDNGKAVRAHVGALLEAEGLLNPLGLKS